MQTERATVASKLLAIGFVLLLLALGSIGLTLWVSWQLEGGAAAVNEAGRMRMLTYRLSSNQAGSPDALDSSIEQLHAGDPSRPLFVPWDADTRERFAAVEARWKDLRQAWARSDGSAPDAAEREQFVALIDDFVSAIERNLSARTDVLRAFQLALVALAIASAVALLYSANLFVLEPLQRLKRGLGSIREGDFSARVEQVSNDEFGELADGFNRMAEHLQALYRSLEDKVAEKTQGLKEKSERLAALYEVSAFISGAETLPELARGFAFKLRRIARAGGVAVRWSDEGNERYLMLAADGLPEVITEGEQCLPSGNCHCGQPATDARLKVIPLRLTSTMLPGYCARLGYRTLVTVPVALHNRVLGEVDLLYHESTLVSDEERALYEALASHLAAGFESLRGAALEKESAMSQERTLLAQELHDSIAQSLAFLKIQTRLLRDAVARGDEKAMQRCIDELELGVHESYADVRELLVHFRTRASGEDIGAALRTTLSKFEHQSGVRTRLTMEGHGVALPADVQIQVLHVVQEALSNVRKHAHAGEVILQVTQAPQWRFSITDDGCGFDPDDSQGALHVGLSIMRERAARIGAHLRVQSRIGQGTVVELSLPPATSLLAASQLPADSPNEHTDTTAGG